MAKSVDPRIQLTHLRKQIDSIDRKLLKLFNDRAKVAKKIGAVKRDHSMSIIEPAREQQVVANMITANKGPLPNDSIERIYLGIMIEMRNIQRQNEPETPAKEEGN
jgi:chorismate mutase